MYKQELEKLEKDGLLRSLKQVDSAQGPRILLDGKEVINLCSNNYLGLANHPALKEAAIRAIEKYGVGSSASRLISGTSKLHKELEEKIAEFKGLEAALVFNSGYTANVGIISVLVGRGDIIFSDKLNHASIVDGCLLSGAELKRYPHKDMDALENMLKKIPSPRVSGEACPRRGRVRVRGEGKKLPPSSLSFPFGGRRDNVRRLIITDTVFSMDGDLAPLPELVQLAEKYDCLLMVDEAHATGVLGESGKGAVEYFGMEDRFRNNNFIQMGTLSKALGGFGAYVAGSRTLIDFIINKSRPFIYTTALPAPVVAAAIAALEVVQAQAELRSQLWDNVKFFKAGLEKIGTDTIFSIRGKSVKNGVCPYFLTMQSQTQIIPILIGDNQRTIEISNQLLDEGIFIQAIRPPTVPVGQARLRLTVMATHTKEDLARTVEILRRLNK